MGDTDFAEAINMVEAAMRHRKWNVRDLAREAELDAGTVGDFLGGVRWPRRSTQARIEAALGFSTNALRDAALGRAPVTRAAPAPPPSTADDIITAIESNADLLPAAKAHLVNQLELLLLVQGASPDVLEQQERRRQQAALEEPRRARLEAVEEVDNHPKGRRKNPRNDLR